MAGAGTAAVLAAPATEGRPQGRRGAAAGPGTAACARPAGARPPGTGQPGPGWAELHCHSSYSFLDGASSPADLVAEAADAAWPPWPSPTTTACTACRSSPRPPPARNGDRHQARHVFGAELSLDRRGRASPLGLAACWGDGAAAGTRREPAGTRRQPAGTGASPLGHVPARWDTVTCPAGRAAAGAPGCGGRNPAGGGARSGRPAPAGAGPRPGGLPAAVPGDQRGPAGRRREGPPRLRPGRPCAAARRALGDPHRLPQGRGPGRPRRARRPPRPRRELGS